MLYKSKAPLLRWTYAIRSYCKVLYTKVTNVFPLISTDVIHKSERYGGTGGDPWTDYNNYLTNGQLTAIEIRSGHLINGIRARYKI